MKTLISCLLSAFITLSLNAQQSYNIGFTHAGKNVYGTFTKPNGTGKFPVIIINPGSGPNDRHGTIIMTGGNFQCLYPNLYNDTVRSYKELANGLVDSGYAVLRYDKLEYTYPGTLGTITFQKLWLPVESAIKYVKTRTDVDTNRIILLGHSEGSALIPYIAKGRNDVKALISLAGARTPFDSILAYQIVNIAQTCGQDVSQAQAQAGQILDYFNTIRTNTWNSSTPDLFGVPASVWYDYVLATDPVATNYNQDALPTLFIGLAKDINVPPSELQRFKNEVTVTNDFWSIPGLIHYMTPDYDPHVPEILADTIVYWLRKKNLHTGMAENPAKLSMSVYPNPSSSAIIVSVKATDPLAKLSIKNMLGQEVYAETFNPASSATIDLSQFSPAVYFLEVMADGIQSVQKIVKE